MTLAVRRTVVAAIVATAVGVTGACSLLDRRSEAEDVEQQLAAMPGVTGTNLTYSSGFAGERFSLNVTLSESATEDEAADIGGAFVHGRSKEGLGGYDGSLTLKHPAAQRIGDSMRYESNASFSFGKSDGLPDPSADSVADGSALWLRIVRSPVVNQVDLSEPNRDEPHDRPRITIDLLQGVTAAAAAEFQRDTPGLDQASWVFSVPFGDYDGVRDYVSTPAPPSDADMALWTEISTVIGKYYDAKGFTDADVGARQAVTELEVDIPQSADSARDIEPITRGVAALLPRFGHPAALLVRVPSGSIELLVGGCYRHRPDHRPLPLEVELSRQYERC